MVGERILRVEGQQIIVAAALNVKIAAQPGQEMICLAQFGAGVGGAWSGDGLAG